MPAASTMRTAAAQLHVTRGRIAAESPDAATRSGDGVWPAASTADNASLYGSLAAMAAADAGRRAGSGDRHSRMILSVDVSRSGQRVDGSRTVLRSRTARSWANEEASKGRLP